jgi:hypothetical protein
LYGSGAHMPAIDAGTETEFGAEGAVEIGHVAKAAIEGDIEDARRLRREPHRRGTEPGPEDVSVRRHTGQGPEQAEEVVRAQARLSRQASQGVDSMSLGRRCGSFDSAISKALSRSLPATHFSPVSDS